MTLTAMNFSNRVTRCMTQGCYQANLTARGNKINIFGLQSHDGSWQVGGMASDAKSKKNPAAEAAGNSPQMIFQHYRELVRPKEAKAWFAIGPR